MNEEEKSLVRGVQQQSHLPHRARCNSYVSCPRNLQAAVAAIATAGCSSCVVEDSNEDKTYWTTFVLYQ